MNVPTSLKDERGSFCFAFVSRALLCFIQIDVVCNTFFSIAWDVDQWRTYINLNKYYIMALRLQTIKKAEHPNSLENKNKIV